MTNEKLLPCREAFEKWYCTRYIAMWVGTQSAYKASSHYAEAWEAWQARATTEQHKPSTRGGSYGQIAPCSVHYEQPIEPSSDVVESLRKRWYNYIHRKTMDYNHIPENYKHVLSDIVDKEIGGNMVKSCISALPLNEMQPTEALKRELKTIRGAIESIKQAFGSSKLIQELYHDAACALTIVEKALSQPANEMQGNEELVEVLEMVNRTIKNGDLILVGSSYHKWIEKALSQGKE